MSIVLAHRLRGFHHLLEMALKDERAQPRPNHRTITSIKKKKLATKDRLAVCDGAEAPSASHS